MNHYRQQMYLKLAERLNLLGVPRMDCMDPVIMLVMNGTHILCVHSKPDKLVIVAVGKTSGTEKFDWEE